MRPFALDPLFKALTTLPGIGPRFAKLFEKLVGGPKVVDLLWHKPIDLVDRRFSPKISEVIPGKVATLRLRVHLHQPPARPSQPFRVLCGDETGMITLIFFHAKLEWIQKQLPKDGDVIVSGLIDVYDGRPQMVHPDSIGKPEDFDSIATVEAVYPLTAGVTNKQLTKAVRGALKVLPDLPEWNDPAWVSKNGWAAWRDAVHAVHVMDSASVLDPAHPARARLAYDEILSNQLALALVRSRQKRRPGRQSKGNGRLRGRIKESLPFDLTACQRQALEEIDADMASPSRMLRLLQGDVGSGKTVVAALAMMNAVECGAQAAIMAPTEILARQHAQSLKPWFEAAGVRFVVLTGRSKGSEREVLLDQIRSGAAQVVIGTHAIFQESVEFQDLALAVIDEQHRFGVHQRLMLSEKGKGTDILVMTATPIPRTLALTAYGDMDVSCLTEKPPGRKPVDTRLISADRTEAMIDGLARQIEAGARAYWVCPLVEESEIVDLAAAQTRFTQLQNRFMNRVGLVHGRMKPEEKDAVMEAFARGNIALLVATTVIEVGVNVPEATIMIVEHAERFGLAQLHQLRGRVGRGGEKSYCFLLYHGQLGEAAQARLQMMRQTEDGFLIAEKDLELRGGGEILGTKQSGIPEFRLADLSVHAEYLSVARDDARLILERDPELETPRGKALRHLLYLFERDQAIAYLRSG